MSARTRLVLLLAAAAVALVAAQAALAVPPPAPGLPDLDTASDSGSSTTDNITNDTTPTFTIDAGAAQSSMTVTLYVASGSSTPVSYGTAVVPASGIVSITASPALADGTYSITAKTSNGPETSAASPALSLQVDSTAPTLASAPSLIDFIGSNPALTFTSTPRLDVVAPTDVSVQLYEGATARGSAVVAVNGIARVVPSPLSEGSHTLYARGTDTAGNVSAASPSVTFTVDSIAPTATTPDLLDADDDGDSASDNYTANPRPRFVVQTEASARVTIYEDGVVLGSAIADASGVATVRVGDTVWLDPGLHCVYAIATDRVGNTGAETVQLCITIAPGAAPFTANLGIELAEAYVAMALRPTLASRATIRVLQGGRTVLAVKRSLAAAKRTRVRLLLPPSARKAKRLVVVTTLVSADERRLVIRRTVRRLA